MPIDPEQPCFCRIPVKCIPAVVAALKAAGFDAEADAVDDFTRSYTDEKENAYRLRFVALAQAEAIDGEVAFDSDATISYSPDDGEYVLGWVWVDAPESDVVDDDNSDDAIVADDSITAAVVN